MINNKPKKIVGAGQNPKTGGTGYQAVKTADSSNTLNC